MIKIYFNKVQTSYMCVKTVHIQAHAKLVAFCIRHILMYFFYKKNHSLE